MSPEPLSYTIQTASAVTDIPVTALRNAINHGELPAIKVGRRIYIRVDELRDWMGRLPTATRAADDEASSAP